MREKSLKSKKILYTLPISDLHIKILCIFIADKFFLYEIVLFIYFKVRNHQTTFRTSKGLHELHFPRWEAPIFLLVMLKSTLTSMHLWPRLAKKNTSWNVNFVMCLSNEEKKKKYFLVSRKKYVFILNGVLACHSFLDLASSRHELEFLSRLFEYFKASD